MSTLSIYMMIIFSTVFYCCMFLLKIYLFHLLFDIVIFLRVYLRLWGPDFLSMLTLHSKSALV